MPLGLDYPYWVDDHDFDLDYHVRELALARPGSDAQLAAQVARIIARPLDRARPLWELYLIHGLRSGHTAMLTKIHHAVIDGLSGAEIMGLLLDLTPEGRELPAQDGTGGGAGGAAGDAGGAEMLARGAARRPALPAACPAVAALGDPQHRGHAADQPAGRRDRRTGRPGACRTPSCATGRGRAAACAAPRTSFNGRISPHRRFAFGQLSLDEVKAVKNAHGCTVNDVVVAICAGAVRRWLLEHDELPDEPLVAQMPVSVRTSEQIGTYGNRILLMSAPLFTNEPDPVDAPAAHTRRDGRDEGAPPRAARRAAPGRQPLHPAGGLRAGRAAHAAPELDDRVRPTWNLVISNVPGPQFPLYCAGARLEANYPISVITDGMGLNITVMSYCGHLDFGLVADRDQMPDLDKLIGWLGESLDELKP